MPKFVNVLDFREAARRRLPRIAFDYLEPGAEDGITSRRNRAVFERLAFQPSMLSDVAEVDLSTSILGHPCRLPLVIGPTGFAGLFWPQADRILAESAAQAGIPFVLSTASTTSIEQIARCGGGMTPHWFQLYLLNDRAATTAMVQRAAEAGYDGIVLTVDTACAGKRDASIRHGSRLPLKLDAQKLLDFASHPHWSWQMARYGQPRLANFPYERNKPFVMEKHLKKSVGWDDVRWLRSIWPGKLILKGIMNVDEAAQAVQLGVDGIVVSNHGGRQLDGALSPVSVLESIVERVGQQLTVMVDSGFRRGSDVVKALALGAKAVWLGRATLYGVAAVGDTGPQQVLSIFADEMTRAMKLSGRRNVQALDTSVVRWMETGE